MERGGVAVLSRKPAISLKRGKIGPMTNRKLRTRFRLVPKSETVDDLERPYHFALCFKIHSFSEPTTKIWMKIDPHCKQQRCSAMTVVSGNIWFMRIFAGVPWRRGVKRQWGNRKTSTFRAFGRYVFGTLGNEANIIM